MPQKKQNEENNQLPERKVIDKQINDLLYGIEKALVDCDCKAFAFVVARAKIQENGLEKEVTKFGVRKPKLSEEENMEYLLFALMNILAVKLKFNPHDIMDFLVKQMEKTYPDVQGSKEMLEYMLSPLFPTNPN